MAKVCTKCKLPDQEFGKNKLASDGLQSWCKGCIREYQRERYADPVLKAREKDRQRRRYHEHPEGNKAHLKFKYGLTVEQYKAMVKAQAGLCAICRQPPRGKKKRLGVDHDHETGAVRGLLCGTCNTAIGHLAESRDSLRRAARYLARFIKKQEKPNGA